MSEQTERDLDDLTSAALALRATVAEERRRKRVDRIILVVQVAVILVGLVLVGLLLRQSRQNGDAIEKTSEAVEILKDCTTPSSEGDPHPCAERSAKAGLSLSCGIANEVVIRLGLSPVEEITVNGERVRCPDKE